MKLKISSNGYIDINSENWMHSENSEVIQWLLKGNTPEPEFTEDELEVQRVQAIKQKAAELINSKYPDYKQLNIIRVGGSELDAMTAYIDGIRAISNEAESNGTKVEDIQWL